MILGRNAGLWAGLVQAGINLLGAVLVVTQGHDLTAAEAAVFFTGNVFGAALVGLVANAADPTTAATFAPTIQPPALSIATASPSSSLSNGTPLSSGSGGGTARSTGGATGDTSGEPGATTDGGAG